MLYTMRSRSASLSNLHSQCITFSHTMKYCGFSVLGWPVMARYELSARYTTFLFQSWYHCAIGFPLSISQSELRGVFMQTSHRDYESTISLFRVSLESDLTNPWLEHNECASNKTTVSSETHGYNFTRVFITIILCGKLREATMEYMYTSHVHRGGTCDPSCLIWYN